MCWLVVEYRVNNSTICHLLGRNLIFGEKGKLHIQCLGSSGVVGGKGSQLNLITFVSFPPSANNAAQQKHEYFIPEDKKASLVCPGPAILSVLIFIN